MFQKYDTGKSDLENKISAEEKKIPNTNGLVKNTTLNAKITEIENQIPSISDVATNSALNGVENKIPDVSSLVKKTNYDAKISEVESKVNNHDHDKYITTSEFNKRRTDNFKARLAQVNFVTKTDFDAKLQDISKRITSNKSEHFLAENELKNYKNFMGRNRFEEDSVQNYLVFQPMYKYFKKIEKQKKKMAKECIQRLVEVV